MRSPTKTSPWPSPAAVLTMMMLASLGAGCGQQRQPPAESFDKRVLAEDSRAMADLYAQWQRSLHSQGLKTGANQQMPLVLSEEVQYRFVLNRLKARGFSPENAPRLFKHLAELHGRKAPPERPMGTPGQARAAGVSGPEASEEVWCGHMIPIGAEGSDATRARFQGTALTSCFGGSDYAYVDLTAFATDSHQQVFEHLDSAYDEEYAGKVLETAPLTVSLARDGGKQLLADSLAMAFNELTGQEQLTYTSVTATPASMDMDGDIVVEHPRELLNEIPWDQAIRVCLERGSVHGFLDCDYGAVRVLPDGTWEPFPSSGATGIAAVDAAASKATAAGGGTPTWIPDRSAYWEPAVKPFDPTRFQVPARGVVRPHILPECTVTKVTSKVAAILMDSGGWCAAGSSPGTLVGKGELPFVTPTMPGEYPFDGIMDFGTGNCVDNAQNVRLEIWTYAEGTCPDPWGGAPEPFRCPAKVEVKPVDYKRVCLAEGTRVTRADGQPVTVEQVKVGDKLLANGKGLALTVTTVHRGGESKPLVKLRDDQGHEVRVTETHPLVSAQRGVVQAGELKTGEAVLTRAGVRKLVSVERVPYEGRVFNFSLGTPGELAGQGPEAHTMFANGFLVGDSLLQTELEKQKRVDARQVLARLNGAWHEDLRLSRARHAKK
ncbi:Hint domain-containing protein [Archangium sp.]|uniref:Hint domain-containing protein n=1 Tax=Archangium sp. TaxID=1872627 RepID=UPI00389AF05C